LLHLPAAYVLHNTSSQPSDTVSRFLPRDDDPREALGASRASTARSDRGLARLPD